MTYCVDIKKVEKKKKKKKGLEDREWVEGNKLKENKNKKCGMQVVGKTKTIGLVGIVFVNNIK